MNAAIVFKFEAPKGSRVLRSRFLGIQTDGDKRWSRQRKRWLSDDFGNAGYSNTAPCRSFAAFRGHIRRHRADLIGERVRLVSRFPGCDIIAEIPE